MFDYTAGYTDQYQLAMAQVYFLKGRKEERAVFDYFFRKLPFEGGYAVFAGLEDLLDALETLHFDERDLDFLGQQGMDSRFVEYLRAFRFRGDLYSSVEGDIVFATRPVLQVEGTLIETQIIETLLLNILNFQTLIATKASRMRWAAGERTLVDFAGAAGASFTQQERDLMKSSLFISNWDVVLNSSAQTPLRQATSKALPAVVREGAERFSGDMVLGARVNFPTEPWNAWALIKPPFEIPASDPRFLEPGHGAVSNIGTLKQVGLTVYGLNFPHTISVILQNEMNEQQEIMMGHLQFDGWRQLVWDNPNYIVDVRNRELRLQPLYPYNVPTMKIVGFRIYRDGAAPGGDFITYLRDVTVIYDLARLQVTEDIEHDALWEILSNRERARQEAELRRLGNLQVLRFIEGELKAQDADLRDPDR